MKPIPMKYRFLPATKDNPEDFELYLPEDYPEEYQSGIDVVVVDAAAFNALRETAQAVCEVSRHNMIGYGMAIHALREALEAMK